MNGPTPGLTPPPDGVVQVWSDLLCPFTHILLESWRRARAGDSALAAVAIEHRSFPLELFNGPHPRRGTDTEAVGLGQIAPTAGFRVWTGTDDSYPHTVLLAAEAVLAASAQGYRAGEALDAALRRAFWTHSRSIAHRGIVLDIAAETASAEPSSGLDVDALTETLDTGACRHLLRRDYRIAQGGAVPGSPTVVLPDASVNYNPGVTVHWEGPWAEGFPVVDEFDAAAQVDLLARSAPATATQGTAGTSR